MALSDEPVTNEEAGAACAGGPSAWRVFWGTVVSPRRTFSDLGRDDHAARNGALVLLLVSFVYTFILLVFIARGYPAAARSVLNLPTTTQYRVQLWYEVPLFFAGTALSAWLLTWIARWSHRNCAFRIAFGRLALATAVPFALTTMLVEFAVAFLLALGVLAPAATLRWLTGDGAWFAAMYQVVGLVWLAALVVIAVRATAAVTWRMSVAGGVSLLVVYGLPIALLIR